VVETVLQASVLHATVALPRMSSILPSGVANLIGTRHVVNASFRTRVEVMLMPLTSTPVPLLPMWDCGRSTPRTGVNAMAEMPHATPTRISSVPRRSMHGVEIHGDCGQLTQAAVVDRFINGLQFISVK
jgi:hypothetical protein